MISEIFGLLSSVDVSGKGPNRKISINLNRNRIRSISAFSSNSIFYFPTIVSDQTTPDEVAMIARMVEKAYASFVVACISLMPFHRIKADDRASIEEYLNQFHQNIGMNPGSGAAMNKLFGFIDTLDESVSDDQGVKMLQDFLYECWIRSRAENTNLISIISETISLNDMYNVDAIDPKTRALQERYAAVQEELDTWGFLGEATDDFLDSDMSILADMSDEEIVELIGDDDDEYPDIDDDDFDDDDFEDGELDEGIVGGLTDYAAMKASRALGNAIRNRKKKKAEQKPVNEGTVKSAIDNIRFSLESVSANKIMSCSSLTKLATLESKLKKLKNKYTKYLNRYKTKYNENKKKGTNSKLSIRFNNMQISNPKAFMKQYGKYIKIINKRLALVEKRRAELRKRKGIQESADVDLLTQMDFDAIEFCDKVITECLEAPDSDVFMLIEAGVNATPGYQLVSDTEADITSGYISDLEWKINQQNSDYIKLQKKTENLEREASRQGQSAKSWENKSRLQTQANRKLKSEVEDLKKKNAELEKGSSKKSDDDLEVRYDRNRSRNNMSAARVRKVAEFQTFDREVFTKIDMQKANEAIPIFAKASIGFIVDETEEVVSRDVLIGVKAYIHKAPSMELINDLYNCIINKRKFLKFVKFITGEERSLSDLLFGIKELKTDALDAKGGSGQWRSAFKRRRRWAKMSIPYLTKEYTPNGTIVMTMNEVEFIKDQYGIDIMNPDHVKMIMDADFLLGFVIVDQSNEMVYVTYDGHGYGFQQYTYAMLEREANISNRELTQLYRSFANR